MEEQVTRRLPGGRTVMLGIAGFVLAVMLALAASGKAEAQEATSLSVDSDGYVPVYSTCRAGDQLGFYNWEWDGYTTQGYILVNDCALQRYGAGPVDRSRIVAHERGHALGVPHSPDPSSVMYPVLRITGR